MMGTAQHHSRRCHRQPAIRLTVVLLALVSCAQPLGPTVQVLPPPGKSFDAFQADQRTCSLYTNDQVRPLRDSADRATIASAAVGTLLGAGLGAAIGGGRGAGIGAASGAVAGTAVGGDQYTQSLERLQVIYNNTFAGYMVAHGDIVQAAPAPQAIVVAPPAIVVQPPPYLVTPAPYFVQPAL